MIDFPLIQWYMCILAAPSFEIGQSSIRCPFSKAMLNHWRVRGQFRMPKNEVALSTSPCMAKDQSIKVDIRSAARLSHKKKQLVPCIVYMLHTQYMWFLYVCLSVRMYVM